MSRYSISTRPTNYHGVRFRSRLEGTYACFFDLTELVWRYEPFAVAGRYLPDFLIATGTDAPGYLVEVKPAKSLGELEADKARCEYLCRDDSWSGQVEGLLLLGARPWIGWQLDRDGCSWQPLDHTEIWLRRLDSWVRAEWLIEGALRGDYSPDQAWAFGPLTDSGAEVLQGLCKWLARRECDLREILDVARRFSEECCIPPLEDRMIVATAKAEFDYIEGARETLRQHSERMIRDLGWQR